MCLGRCRAWETLIQAPTAPAVGTSIEVVFQSRHDELIHYGAFLALDANGPMLKDGRTFPLGLNPLFILAQSQLDPAGQAVLDMQIPQDQNLIGLKVYFAFATYSPIPFYFLSFSEAAMMEIQ